MVTCICCWNIGQSCFSEFLSKQENAYERAIYQVAWTHHLFYFQNPKGSESSHNSFGGEISFQWMRVFLYSFISFSVVIPKFCCRSVTMFEYGVLTYTLHIRCMLHVWIPKCFWPTILLSVVFLLGPLNLFSVDDLPLRFSSWHHLFWCADEDLPCLLFKEYCLRCCRLDFVLGMGLILGEAKSLLMMWKVL